MISIKAYFNHFRNALRERFSASANFSKGTMSPALEQKIDRKAKRFTKRYVKNLLRVEGVRQGYEAKALLIRDGKGKHGRSMSPELLKLHGIA